MAWMRFQDGVSTGDSTFHVCHDYADGIPSLRAGWAIESGKLSAYADRLGLIPIFMAKVRGGIALATTLKEIANLLPHRELDDAAIAAFLAFGYFLSDTTPLKGVTVLSPGADLQFSHNGIKINVPEYQDFGLYAGSYNDAKAHFQHLFRAAIAKRTSTQVGPLPLSGGRDSRHILLELMHLGTPPSRIVTLSGEGSDDCEIALRLAAEAGLPYSLVEQTVDPFLAETKKNRLNNYLSDENAWYMDLLPHLEGVVFDGLAGDVLCNNLYYDAHLADLLEGDQLIAASEMLAFSSTHLGFLTDAFRKRWSPDAALDLLRTELSRHTTAPNPVKSFIFWNRTRREIATLPVLMAATRCEIALPYLDEDVFSFLISLPHSRFARKDFHDEVIYAAHPRFSSVPFSGGRKPTSSAHQIRNLASNLKNAYSLNGPVTKTSRLLYYALADTANVRSHALESGFKRVRPILQLSEDLAVALEP